jgi:hypothetical protein
MASTIYDSRASVRQLLDGGFEMPIHFVAMGTDGSVVVGTYRLSPDRELDCQITIPPPKEEGLSAPVNIMYVDHNGKAALVVVRRGQDERKHLGALYQ